MTALKTAASLFLSALREIFDEAAYDRFLRRSELPSSPSAYAAFRLEQDSRKGPTRCC